MWGESSNITCHCVDPRVQRGERTLRLASYVLFGIILLLEIWLFFFLLVPGGWGSELSSHWGGGVEPFVLRPRFWLHLTGLKLDSHRAYSRLIFSHQQWLQQECSRNCHFDSVCILLSMITKIKVRCFSLKLAPGGVLPSLFFYIGQHGEAFFSSLNLNVPGWGSHNSRIITFNKKSAEEKSYITWAVAWFCGIWSIVCKNI